MYLKIPARAISTAPRVCSHPHRKRIVLVFVLDFHIRAASGRLLRRLLCSASRLAGARTARFSGDLGRDLEHIFKVFLLVVLVGQLCEYHLGFLVFVFLLLFLGTQLLRVLGGIQRAVVLLLRKVANIAVGPLQARAGQRQASSAVRGRQQIIARLRLLEPLKQLLLDALVQLRRPQCLVLPSTFSQLHLLVHSDQLRLAGLELELAHTYQVLVDPCQALLVAMHQELGKEFELRADLLERAFIIL